MHRLGATMDHMQHPRAKLRAKARGRRARAKAKAKAKASTYPQGVFPLPQTDAGFVLRSIAQEVASPVLLATKELISAVSLGALAPIRLMTVRFDSQLFLFARLRNPLLQFLRIWVRRLPVSPLQCRWKFRTYIQLPRVSILL